MDTLGYFIVPLIAVILVNLVMKYFLKDKKKKIKVSCCFTRGFPIEGALFVRYGESRSCC